MNEPTIIIQGMSMQDFKISMADMFKEIFSEYEQKKVAPLSKTEAGERLGITYKTLVKIMDEMKLKDIYPSDINRILLRYPKYIKKAQVVFS